MLASEEHTWLPLFAFLTTTSWKNTRRRNNWVFLIIQVLLFFGESGLGGRCLQLFSKLFFFSRITGWPHSSVAFKNWEPLSSFSRCWRADTLSRHCWPQMFWVGCSWKPQRCAEVFTGHLLPSGCTLLVPVMNSIISSNWLRQLFIPGRYLLPMSLWSEETKDHLCGTQTILMQTLWWPSFFNQVICWRTPCIDRWTGDVN